MTTYGDLIRGAVEHTRAGTTQLREDPFWSAAEAQTSLIDFHGVLDAIAGHALAKSPAEMESEAGSTARHPASANSTSGVIAGGY